MKLFCIATEGATTDGRAITATQIEQMAKNYNTSKYGARIWLEHIRGLYSDSSFPALGDVLSLTTKKNDEGKLQLLAELRPTANLVAMNQDRQKIYSSIEMDPDFAKTGEAYLVGLAVTDSPASLGTDVLQFSSTAAVNPFTARKQRPENLFTAATEAKFDFTKDSTEENPGQKFMDKIKGMLGMNNQQQDKKFSEHVGGIMSAIEALAESQRDLLNKFSALPTGGNSAEVTKLTTDLTDLQTKFNELKSQLDTTPGGSQKRPIANGGGNTILTDC